MSEDFLFNQDEVKGDSPRIKKAREMAPELLEVLESLVSEYRHNGAGRTLQEDCQAIDDVYDVAEKLLAKLEGGSQ